MQIEDMDMQSDLQDASIIDKWILRRFNEVLASVTANMERYELALVGNELYGFIWDEFCSWYMELSKAGPVSYTHLDVYKRQAEGRGDDGRVFQ